MELWQMDVMGRVHLATPSPTTSATSERPIDDQRCERARHLPIGRLVGLRVLQHREGHVCMADARAMAVRCYLNRSPAVTWALGAWVPCDCRRVALLWQA